MYHDESSTVAAGVLDLDKLFMRHHHTSWVTRIGSQND
jgi:hypothetical protein